VLEDANPPAPYQTLMVCVTVSEPRPACTRAQSIQSVASPSHASGVVPSVAGGPSVKLP
jgi:hypothetical protein